MQWRFILVSTIADQWFWSVRDIIIAGIIKLFKGLLKRPKYERIVFDNPSPS